MKIAITGATGNVGTSLLEALADDPVVDRIVGIARRAPALNLPRTEWVRADIAVDDLVPHLRGMDAVVHLAWSIQPSRDLPALRRTNVEGSRRVFEAAIEADVKKIVYASSVGTYSEGPKDEAVDESWPTEGVPTSFYSRHKSEVERILDEVERSHPDVAVVRMRPALIFKKDAATGIRRLFAGPLLPGPLLRRSLIPVVPVAHRLVFQCVHSRDVAEAYRLALHKDLRGAFNLAADPVIGPEELSSILGALPLRVPRLALRLVTLATWKARLQPTPPGWVDMAFSAPVMDTGRARLELGWQPKVDALDALIELLDGLHDGTDYPTPPLAEDSSGPLRAEEFASGVGARDDQRAASRLP